MDLLNEFKTVVKKKKISADLKHITLKAISDNKIFFKVVYLKGKFVIEKIFNNDISGKSELYKFRKKLDSEKKVRSYLGL